MRGAKEINTEPRMAGFREALSAKGYGRKTISIYCSGIKKYMEAGYPMDPAFAFKLSNKAEWKEFLPSHQTGILKFMDYISGKPLQERIIRKRKNNKCNYDCFNCVYPDCVL